MRVCFVVPAHGRIPLARICLERLAQVCDELDARAVVVACDANLDIARQHGLQTIVRDNKNLGRRFNDGIAYAAARADYVFPLGSDDLIAPGLVRRMLSGHDGNPDRIIATRHMAAVSPAGELALLRIKYADGAGPSLVPAAALARCAYRPADDHGARAIDSSIRRNLRARGPLTVTCIDSNPLELVDLKTDGANLNTFEMLLPYATARRRDTWDALATVHPRETIDKLRALYT